MCATLARSTDKSRFLVPIHAQVSLSSILSYRFRVALYGELNRAKWQKNNIRHTNNICLRHWQDHMFPTLARSSYETASSSKMRAAATCMFVGLRPLRLFGVSEATLFETVFETQKKYKKDQTNVIFNLLWKPKKAVFEVTKPIYLKLFWDLKTSLFETQKQVFLRLFVRGKNFDLRIYIYIHVNQSFLSPATASKKLFLRNKKNCFWLFV